MSSSYVRYDEADGVLTLTLTRDAKLNAVNGEIPPPPVFVDLIPGALSVLLLLVPIIFDWRTRGRPHPYTGPRRSGP